jgi:hypothetical protein
LARKYASDPPTLATTGMTMLFASIFFATQVVLSAVAFFAGCLCVVSTSSF